MSAAISDTLGEVVFLLAVLLGPLFVFTLIIHRLERTIQTRMAERFGWKSVMWTGWLGTPLHELSHAAMCVLFNHRIDKLVLFEPDERSGRLGYVLHSYRQKNWFEQIGNVFIGIAPLIGGSIALALLLWSFYPEAARSAIETSRLDGTEQTSLTATISIVVSVGMEVLALENFATLKFWGFLYLVLCIGSHMAPSTSDYAGAGRGLILLAVPSLVLLILFATLTPVDSQIVNLIVEILSPLFAVLLLTIVLCSIATLIVYFFTAFFPRVYQVQTR